jgi:hypothetical protein
MAQLRHVRVRALRNIISKPDGLLYHGSRIAFSRFAAPSPYSRLHAAWATTDPVAAATYAGPGGWVMPLRVTAGCCLLNASGGVAGRPLHHVGGMMDELIRLCERRWDGTLDCLDPDRIACGLVHLLGPDGTPAWESFVWEDVDCEDLHAVLTGFGYQAVACTEPSAGVLGDLARAIAGAPEPSPFLASVELLTRRMAANGGYLDVVGFLDPDAADFSGLTPIPADRVLTAAAEGRPPPPTDLASVLAGCASPDTVSAERSLMAGRAFPGFR